MPDGNVLDILGAGHYYIDAHIAFKLLKSEVLYLEPGLHVIDVAVRGKGAMPIVVMGGVLTIETFQYDGTADLGGVRLMNVSALN
ncbi:unnamed protein product [Rotaria sp. Silwood2]|nr:unnamed protein product [Rotaria sp. Silwood2]CAF3227499.1 unnamed protein product [Rotaria sp. Silwood2]CAF3314792.1 unnamed protein product [Rotaria sp. Silwood2]CAF3455260.1 unnamed protein product [Rotaria sp. Silwood2]CAF4302059.1 unnamed protein product [Rotaria sp. Silwood2]